MNSSGSELLEDLPTGQIPFRYSESRRHGPAAGPQRPSVPPVAAPESGPRLKTPSQKPQIPEPQPSRLSPPVGVPLPCYLTRFLRSVAGLDLAAGTWLLAAGSHPVLCITRVCEVATLNGRHVAAGLIALVVAVLLAGAAVFTSGLTRANSVTRTVLIGIALTGLLAVIGVVLATALILLVIGVALGAVIGIVVGAIRGDLTR